LTERCAEARAVVAALFPGRRRPGKSYTGFVDAMKSWSSALLQVLAEHLRDWMFRNAGPYRLRQGFLAFAVDGSRVELPRTAANQTEWQKFLWEECPFLGGRVAAQVYTVPANRSCGLCVGMY
jgi:hypothetical protein